VHGGVRYLEEALRQLDPAEYRVVDRALHERILMLQNAPYLARPLEFLVPCYRWLDAGYYDIGLKVYDWIAGQAGLSPSRFLSRQEALARMPTLHPDHLVGAVSYSDGGFDDARYNLALVKTFTEAGGEAANHTRVTGFRKSAEGRIETAEVDDVLARQSLTVRAKIFVNATGPVSDSVRQMAAPSAVPRMRPSKGAHILLPLEVLSSADALLIPKTDDGRVLFAVPWLGRLLVGTTEDEVRPDEELHVTEKDVAFILGNLNKYLAQPVTADQIVSGFAGARPLVGSGNASDTKSLARDDVLEIDPSSGLISIMGGKWTTHRAMAEDTIDAVQKALGLPVTESLTRNRLLFGSEGQTAESWRALAAEYRLSEGTARHLAGKYGSAGRDVLALIRERPGLAVPLVEGLAPLRAEVAYGARQEMAMTTEDVLARRIGLQFYSWRSAIQAARVAASLLAEELGRNKAWAEDEAAGYTRKVNRWMELAGLAKQA
jgi:glycerol-3-phosphate dehydrogenase